MRVLAMMAACLVLAGCLTTSKPAFDETNSIAAGDSPALVAFVDAWEAEMPKESSPRDLITEGNRVVDMDGLVLVQEVSGSGADYYAVGMIGRRLLLCLVHDEKMDQIAARHGVTLEIKRTDDTDETTPAQMTADGSKEALFAFVIDAYTDGLLVCQAPSELVGGP